MNQDRLNIEDQLRRYADAIDPTAPASISSSAQPTPRRLLSPKSTWLLAAAAVLLLAGIAALTQRDRVQQVDTGTFAQQTDDPSNQGTTDPSTSLDIVPERTDPIYWPGGSTDTIETVELFMDESFPQWRDMSLLVGNAVVPTEPELTASSEAVVEIRRQDGGVFATVPLRFGDGRWFLKEITSPLIDLELTRQLSSNQMAGSVTAQASGAIQIELVYAFERTVESTSTITISNDRVGIPIPITLQQSHQEVQARLVSPTGELLGITVFTAAAVLPAEWQDAVDSTDGCEGCPPRPDDVPATGDWRTREQSLVVMMAQFVLLEECMSDRGLTYTMPTDQEWVELFGGWRPSGILGIGTEGAARSIGYQSDGWGGAGSPTQSLVFNTMSPQKSDEFIAALMGDSAVIADPGALPTPTPAAMSRQVGGCWAFTEATLGDYQNKEISFNALVQWGNDGTQGERFRTDPTLAGAITDWQDCIRDAVGIDADTPNTLARQFAFAGSPASEREREVAVADVRCQQATSLEEAFYLARTRQVRSEQTDNAAAFDDYVRFRIESVALAQQVLTERGIVPPSLD